MEQHLKSIGIILVLLALIHSVFPKYFNWEHELKPLSLINRQIMLVHTFFITLMVFLIGVLCFTSANELVQTPLGRRISLGLGVFWGVRFVIQFVGYSSKLWKGKPFETSVHIVYSILWSYFTYTFIAIYLQ